MKKFKFWLMGLVLIPPLFFGASKGANASASNWTNKAVSIMPASSTDFCSTSFQQSVRNAAAVHVNNIYLIIPLHQSAVGTTDVRVSGNAPTDACLNSAIQFIKSIGLSATLKIHDFPDDGQWSAFINPSDRTTWFNNYGDLVRHYATVAQQQGASQLVIGNELLSMAESQVNSTNTQNWRNLIASVRAIYTGKVFYNANWGGDPGFTDEKDHIQFWDALDAIGISGYFNLTDDLTGSWTNIINNELTPLHNKFAKPIIFSEIGYKAQSGAHTHPWMWWQNDPVNLQEQANDYTALFSSFDTVGFFEGVSLWQWSSDPNAGGPNNNDYTPQGKPAQDVMKQWFGGNNPPPPPPPPPTPGAGVFSTTASFTPTSPATGQTVSFTTSVKNNSAAVSNAIVDFEIYNSANAKIAQNFFSGQNIAQNGSFSYLFTWTPQTAGTYTLKMGVFSADWAHTIFWDSDVSANGAAHLTVGAGGTPPPGPTPASINIWWPTNGSSVSGVQPFKAAIDGKDVNTYSMDWQVDGGVLNAMANNFDPVGHKEAAVNVGGWTWRGSGPYTVNFVAKDSGGAMIAQQSVAITVLH